MSVTTPPAFSEEEAWAAIRAFNAIRNQVEAYARYATGNPKMRVEVTSGITCTNGDVIYIRPPLGLGVYREHDRSLCGRRDDKHRLICDACDKRELIDFAMFHEIAHVAFDSHRKSSRVGRNMMKKYSEKWHSPEACSHGANLSLRLHSSVTAIEIAHLMNPHMVMLVNGFEDARVNELMFQDRAGLRDIFATHMDHILSEDTDINGVTRRCIEYPLDAQLVLGAMMTSMGFGTNGLIVEDVRELLRDKTLSRVIGNVLSAQSPDEILKLAFEFFDRANDLGYLVVAPCVPPPPIPPQEDDDADDSSDDPSSQKGEGSGLKETDGDGDMDKEEKDEAPDDSTDSHDEPDEPDDPDDEEDSAPDEGDDPTGDPSTWDGDGESPDNEEPDASDSDDSDDADSDSDSMDEGGRPEPEGSEEGSSDFDDSAEQSDEDEVGSSSAASDDASDGDEGDGGSSSEDESSESHDTVDSDDSERSEHDGDSSDGEAESSLDEDKLERPLEDAVDGSEETNHESDFETDDGSDPWATEAPEQADVDMPNDAPSDAATGTEAPTLDHGDPSDVAELLRRFGMHEMMDDLADGDMDSITGSPEGEQLSSRLKDMLQTAIDQALLFDKRSVHVGGVEDFNWPYRSSGHNWRRASTDTIRAFMPTGGMLSRAFLVTRRAFDENRRAQIDRNRRSGRIDTGVLGRRAAIGDDRLFGNKTIPARRSYTVLIALDISQSTSYYDRIRKIKRMGFAVSELLAGVGIQFEIIAHSAGYPTDSSRWDRTLRLYIQTVKAATALWNDMAKSKLAGLEPVGANLDGHMFEYSRKHIEKKQATDKILVYVTDGEMPAENKIEEREILIREIETLRRMHVTTIGVGINTDSPKQYGLETVRVDADDDIIKVVEALERHLISKRRERR